MNATTVGVDLAKQYFELVVSEDGRRIVARERLTRPRFVRFFANRPPCRVVMEACGSAHHWGRTLEAQGHQVQLLPAQYVRAYVRRNKTDAADAAALLEALAGGQIRPVPLKSVAQQELQQLHRLREQLKRTRNARVNLLRGVLREHGVAVPVGIVRGMRAIREALAGETVSVPLAALLLDTLQELEVLAERIGRIEATLAALTAEDPVVHQLQALPGIGPLAATALRAAVGNIARFPSGRHFASWIGLTAREHSSGDRRRLGRISKRGDTYLRTLLVHGARAVLAAALSAQRAGKPLDRLRHWVLQVEARRGRNKAIVALANKLARIVWATWRHGRRFDAHYGATPA